MSALAKHCQDDAEAALAAATRLETRGEVVGAITACEEIMRRYGGTQAALDAEASLEGTAKYRLPKGYRKSLEVYNYHRAAAADPAKPLVVVEGFFDCMKICQAGYQRVVAIMGSALSEAQKAALLAVAGGDGRILLLFDEDDAGRKGRDESLLRLAPHAFVRVLSCGAQGLQPDRMTSESLNKLLSFEPPSQNIYEATRNGEQALIVTVNGQPSLGKWRFRPVGHKKDALKSTRSGDLDAANGPIAADFASFRLAARLPMCQVRGFSSAGSGDLENVEIRVGRARRAG